MASYTKIVNRYTGGDAIWTNKSNASSIIVNDFFGNSNDPEPPIDGNATVTIVNINLISNNIIAIGNANSVISLSTLSIQSNSVIAKGSANTSVSVLNSSINANNVIANADANAFTTQLNALLTANGISATGSAIANTSTADIVFTVLDVNPIGTISQDAFADVSTANTTLIANNVNAFVLDSSNNEIVLLNSYITNKINRKSTITNKQKWERYIKVKLILQSKLH